jgi:hypothetical protein
MSRHVEGLKTLKMLRDLLAVVNPTDRRAVQLGVVPLDGLIMRLMDAFRESGAPQQRGFSDALVAAGGLRVLMLAVEFVLLVAQACRWPPSEDCVTRDTLKIEPEGDDAADMSSGGSTASVPGSAQGRQQGSGTGFEPVRVKNPLLRLERATMQQFQPLTPNMRG